MRTTVALDDDLVRTAHEFTGVAENAALLREALKALIERESARRLASPWWHNAAIEEDSTPQAGAKTGRETLILADTSVWIDQPCRPTAKIELRAG